MLGITILTLFIIYWLLLLDIPEKIRRGYQLSYADSKDYLLSNASNDERIGDTIKIMISCSTIPETLNVLKQVILVLIHGI